MARTVHSAPPHRVQLRRTAGWRKPPNTIVVTRGSKHWGNPFKLATYSKYGYVKDAATSIAFFRRWLTEDPEGQAILAAGKKELRGHNLACFCALDAPCHADVWIEMVND